MAVCRTIYFRNSKRRIMSTLKNYMVLAVLCMLLPDAALSVSAIESPDWNNLHAEKIVITGTVYASDTREPIAGAHVTLLPEGQISVTKEDGSFVLDLPEDRDEIRVRVSHIGFRTGVFDFSSGELSRSVELLLDPVASTLSPVTVLAHRDMGSPGSELDPEGSALLPIDSGAFLREAGNASGIRKGGFGIDPVLRGLSGSRLNVRLDGLTTTAAACPNRMDPPTSHIRLSDIERVEIHRGPHALEFGPTFGGTVNFVTHERPEMTDFTLSGDLRAGYESNTGHRKTDMRIRGGGEKWSILLSGGLSGTDDYKSGNSTVVPAGFQSTDYGVEGSVQVSENSRLSAGWSQSFIRNADFPALGMDMAQDDTYKLKSGFEWTPARSDLFREVKLNGYWSLVDHEMNNFNRSSFDDQSAVALAETESAGFHTKTKGLFTNGTFTIAAGLDRQQVDGTRYVEFKTGMMAGREMEYNLWQGAHVTNMGLYSGLEFFAGEWTLSAGARADYNIAGADDPAPRFQDIDSSSDHFNVSVSAGITRPLSATTTAGFYVGRGVRSPDVTERFINFLTIGRDGYEYAGNPDLKPEANNQADFVLTSDFGRFRVEANLFASYMNNYISAVLMPDISPVGMMAPGVRQFRNRGDAWFTGFEFSANADLTNSWYAGISSSYTYAAYADDGSAVAEIPPFEASFKSGGAFFSGKVMPEVSVRRVLPQTRFDAAFAETRTPGFWLSDIQTRVQVQNGITLTGGVRNLFDTTYYEHLNRRFNPGVNSSGDSLYEPGRRFFVELSVMF
jgi:iron complex outermembrane receptor protein